MVVYFCLCTADIFQKTAPFFFKKVTHFLPFRANITCKYFLFCNYSVCITTAISTVRKELSTFCTGLCTGFSRKSTVYFSTFSTEFTTISVLPILSSVLFDLHNSACSSMSRSVRYWQTPPGLPQTNQTICVPI